MVVGVCWAGVVTSAEVEHWADGRTRGVGWQAEVVSVLAHAGTPQNKRAHHQNHLHASAHATKVRSLPIAFTLDWLWRCVHTHHSTSTMAG